MATQDADNRIKTKLGLFCLPIFESKKSKVKRQNQKLKVKSFKF